MDKFIELGESDIINISKVLYISKTLVCSAYGINVYFQGEEEPFSIFFKTSDDRDKAYIKFKREITNI